MELSWAKGNFLPLCPREEKREREKRNCQHSSVFFLGLGKIGKEKKVPFLRGYILRIMSDIDEILARN